MGFGTSRVGSVSSGDDTKKVKVSANDTAEDFLIGKLVAGSGISIVETNDGGDESATISANVGTIDHDSLLNTHNLTTDIDHDALTNTHNLTTDIDHDQLTNTHNLTTDIDHDQLTNFAANEHFTEASIDHTNISNIGTKSHATIDTELGDCIHDNVAGEIAALSEKASPVGTDLLIIEDSADSNNKKKVQITNLPGGADSDAIHDNVAAEISAISEKATPVSADLIIIEDSADSNNKKKVQLGNLPGGFAPENTRIVAKSGGTYSTISAAMSAASAGDVILVYPGTYTETVTFGANNITIKGVGKERVTIGASSGSNTINCGAYTGCVIQDVTISSTTATTDIDAIIGSGDLTLYNCIASHTQSGTIAASAQSAVFGGSQDLIIRECDISYSNAGDHVAAARKAVFSMSGGDIEIYDTDIAITTTNGTYFSVVFDEDGGASFNVLDNVQVNSSVNATYNYCWNFAGSGTREVRNNSLLAVNGGTTAYAIYGKFGATATINIYDSCVDASSVTTNYGISLIIASGATVKMYFGRLNASTTPYTGGTTLFYRTIINDAGAAYGEDYDTSTVESSKSTAGYSTKLSHSTSTISGKVYETVITGEFKGNASGTSEVNILDPGSTDVLQQFENQGLYKGFAIITRYTASASTSTFTIRYQRSAGSGTVYIKNVRARTKRVY